LAAGIEVAHVLGPSAMRMGAPDRTSAVSLDPLPLGIERATRCKSIVRAAQEGRRPRRACEQARTIRCQARWPMRELPAAQIVCVDTHDASEHRAPADEVIRCGRGDRAWMRAVTVLEIAVSAGVDVPDVRVVDDDRIRCVDMSNVTRRMAIPRNVDFARAERKPDDAATEGEGHADARAADPANQRRRVDRSIVTRAGHPAPALTHERPTSVVKWREPPR